VGICLALGVGCDLLLKRRLSTALAAGLVAALAVLPWLAWVLTVHENPQVSHFARNGLREHVEENVLFYMRRLPDMVTGPVVEVGTVFRPSWRSAVTAWAGLATGVLCWGWYAAARSRRRRLGALVPFLTLGLLLFWPYTEAGRFLIPLIPFVLVGTVEGLARLARLARLRRPRVWSAGAVLAAALPFAVYAIATGRAEAERQTHADFDAACRWIVVEGRRPGPVLTRHPGEVYWQTGRRALSPPDDPSAVADVIGRYEVAYLLIDNDRYARAPSNPLSRFAADHPEQVALVWGDTDRVSVYDVRRGGQRDGPSKVNRP
jgi:hypothetical protein